MDAFRIVKNPTDQQYNELIELSTHAAAKWIKAEDGTVYAWPAEAMFHAQAAETMGVMKFTKGIVVPKVTSASR